MAPIQLSTIETSRERVVSACLPVAAHTDQGHGFTRRCWIHRREHASATTVTNSESELFNGGLRAHVGIARPLALEPLVQVVVRGRMVILAADVALARHVATNASVRSATAPAGQGLRVVVAVSNLDSKDVDLVAHHEAGHLLEKRREESRALARGPSRVIVALLAVVGVHGSVLERTRMGFYF